MTTQDDVPQGAADGLVFYDYYDRQYVLQGEPGEVTNVSEAVRALEDGGLIECGGHTGGDMQPTGRGTALLAERRVAQ